MNYKFSFISGGFLIILLCCAFFLYQTIYGGGIFESNLNNNEYINIEEFGAVGDDDDDDSKAIQEAIDYSLDNKIGKVKILGNQRFIVREGIIVKQGIELEFGRNTTLEVQGDFRVFTIKKNASISKGTIEISGSEFASEALYLDGEEQFWSWEKSKIGDLTIINTSGENKGTALALEADGSDEFISFVDFSSLTIIGFHTGVLMKADPPEQDYNFVNGNRFTNLTLEDCVECIVLESAESIPNEVSGNQFSNLQVQLSAATEIVLNVTGSDNRFEGMIWDVEHFTPEDKIITFTPESMRNRVITNISDQYIMDDGNDNAYGALVQP